MPKTRDKKRQRIDINSRMDYRYGYRIPRKRFNSKDFIFECNECSTRTPYLSGRCSNCGAFGSIKMIK